MSNYFISIYGNSATKDETIHDTSTKLKVKAVDLLKSTFKPRKGEVSYFVTCGKKIFAFETEGFKKHRKLLVLQMIAWYCLYLGLIEAQFHSTLPLLGGS